MQETPGTTDWGTATPFNDMRGTLTLTATALNNTELLAIACWNAAGRPGQRGRAANPCGLRNIGLRIVGEIHRDQPAGNRTLLRNVVIPLECPRQT